MAAALIVGVILVVGAVAAAASWRRAVDERHSVQVHQHTLETLRHMSDRRQQVARSAPSPRRTTRPSPQGRPGPAPGPPGNRPARRAATTANGAGRRVESAVERGSSGPQRGAGASAAPVPAARRAGRGASAKVDTSRRGALVFVDDATEPGQAQAVGAPALADGAVPDQPRHVVTAARWRVGARPVPVHVAAVSAAVVILVATALTVALTSGSASPGRSVAHGTRHHPHTITTTVPSRRAGSPSSTIVVPAVATVDSATYSAPAAPYTVQLDASGLCWVLATDTSNGTVVWTGTMAGGQSRALSVTGTVALRLGAASDVRLSMDGRPVELPAGFHSPFTVTFSVA